jgi:dipeptidyl aminopeptidase/acylaminoacyl peptidase
MNRPYVNSRSLSTDQLRDALGEVGGRSRPDYLVDIVAQAGRTRQRPAWTFLERWLSVDIAVRRQGVPRAAVLFAVLTLLVTVLVAAVVYVAAQWPQRESLGARSGVIVFAADAAGGDTLTDRLSYAQVETDPEPMDIYITEEGGSARRLVGTDAHERCPTFSPDGQRLAYLEVPPSDDPGGPSIVVLHMDATGIPKGPETRLPVPEASVSGVAMVIGAPCHRWSPDGTQIAYLAQPADTASPGRAAVELRLLGLDGRETVLDLPLSTFAHGPFAWSPDGRAIAYTSADGVWRAPLDGGPPSLLWRTDGEPEAVTWSARGQVAAIVADGPGVATSVYAVDLDTGAARRLGGNYIYDYRPAWSPDGSRLAFVDGDRHIVLSDASDGLVATLSPRHDDGAEMPFWDVTWSPDGDRLLALARSGATLSSNPDNRRSGFALVSLSTDGTSAEILTPWTWAMDWINLEDASWQPTAR